MASVIVSRVTKPPSYVDQLFDHTVNPVMKDRSVSGFTERVRPLSYYEMPLSYYIIMSSLVLFDALS